MTTDERLKKYVDFANRILAKAQANNLTKVVDLCKDEAIDTHFFSALTKKKDFYFYSKGKKGRWYKSDRIDPYTDSEVESILNQMALRAKTNIINASSTIRPSLSEMGSPLTRLLSEYTPRELIEELKRRGYSGTLTFTKEVKF